MKTPYLDTEIQRLSMLESRDELTDWGKEMLNELKEIKEAVTKNREVKKTNYTKILIKQDGAYALPEVPEKITPINRAPFGFESNVKALDELAQVLYNKLYQQALDNAVKFRDDDYKYIKLFGLGIEDEIVYDCPSGFEIVIENGMIEPCPNCGDSLRQQSKGQCTTPWCYKGREDYLKQYAVLKPIKL
jgi:hypothetical protein